MGVEQGALVQVLHLAVARQQEEHLDLEGEAVGVLIEGGQEGVFLHHLEGQAGVQRLCQQPTQAGLADPDGTFDRDIGHARLHLLRPSIPAVEAGRSR